MGRMSRIGSVAGICDVEVVSGPRSRAGEPPGWLIEVPHGATRGKQFDEIRRRLVGEFPDDLKDFFYVNTDVGSIECARHVARMLVDSAGDTNSVLLVRGLVPRTFIDFNRVIEGGPTAEVRDGVTPGLPEYVTHPRDIGTLQAMHAEYVSVAERAYQVVCGNGGNALILHTYAPRSIRIDRVDDGIVAALHRAYEPGIYETWEKRPDVDLISEDADGERLAPAGLVEQLRTRFARIGVTVAENQTYRLVPETLGYVHSKQYLGRVACIEVSRGLLADPFTPFAEMTIDDASARRMAAPIAAACLSLDRSLGG